MFSSLPEEVKSYLFHWKKRYGTVAIGSAEHKDLGETVFVFRLPTISEFKAYRDLMGTAGYYGAKELVKTCLLYPDMELEQPEDVSNFLIPILFASGFDDDFILLLYPRITSTKLTLLDKVKEIKSTIGEADKIETIAKSRLIGSGLSFDYIDNLTAPTLFSILNLEPPQVQQAGPSAPVPEEIKLPEKRGKQFQLTPEQLEKIATDSALRRTEDVYKQMKPLNKMLFGIPKRASKEDLIKYRQILNTAKKMGLKAGEEINPEKDNLLLNQ